MEIEGSFTPERGSLLGIIGALMLAEHLGDVHDEILLMCDLAGIPRPQGNFMDGWEDEDWLMVGVESGD